MIEKVNTQNLDLVEVFKLRNVDVLAFCDVEENAVNEKQERLDIQMLAPTQTQVKEKFREAFVIDPLTRFLLELVDLLLADAFITLPDLLRFGI